jgi:hypothetical protein
LFRTYLSRPLWFLTFFFHPLEFEKINFLYKQFDTKIFLSIKLPKIQ